MCRTFYQTIVPVFFVSRTIVLRVVFYIYILLIVIIFIVGKTVCCCVGSSCTTHIPADEAVRLYPCVWMCVRMCSWKERQAAFNLSGRPNEVNPNWLSTQKVTVRAWLIQANQFE